MLIRLLILSCLFTALFSGCGSKSGSSTPSFSVPAGTELNIYGIAENAVINRDYLYVTVDRSKSVFRNYTTFEYTLDTQLAEYTPAHFDDPDNKDIKRLTVPIFTGEGAHQFAIRGVMKADPYDGMIHQEYGKKINFRVDYKLNNVAKGKYFGDRTVYKVDKKTFGFTSFSGMRVEFATYSSARTGNTLYSGGLLLTGTNGAAKAYSNDASIFGSAISVTQTHNTVDFQMNSIADAELLSATGTGYDHFMELLLSQIGGAFDRQGDLRLYRNDSGSRILSAMFTSLKATDASLPERQASMTLQSFDNVNFFGHLRLWDVNTLRVWTYQVSAYADASGLGNNKGLVLWLSTSASPLEDFLLRVTPYPDAYNIVNPPGSPVSKKPGVLTVGTDANGKLFITQFQVTLRDALYRAAESSISMKASYKP